MKVTETDRDGERDRDRDTTCAVCLNAMAYLLEVSEKKYND
jgi:hypothetical protein